MKDIIDQATRKGIELSDSGPCQFCGAPMERGVFECFEMASTVVLPLDRTSHEQLNALFLSVDAHALQHPEIHGQWNNHFHLTRCQLILERTVQWNYSDSTRLSNILNTYKIGRPEEILTAPTKRGGMTVAHIRETDRPEEIVRQIGQWSADVYNTWSRHHALVGRIAAEFLFRG